jgi:hypothetical protein
MFARRGGQPAPPRSKPSSLQPISSPGPNSSGLPTGPTSYAAKWARLPLPRPARSGPHHPLGPPTVTARRRHLALGPSHRHSVEPHPRGLHLATSHHPDNPKDPPALEIPPTQRHRPPTRPNPTITTPAPPTTTNSSARKIRASFVKRDSAPAPAFADGANCLRI